MELSGTDAVPAKTTTQENFCFREGVKMIQQSLHNRWLRLFVAGVGVLISAISLNVFIVPQGLYSGGLIGVCQLIRNLLQPHMSVRFFGGGPVCILYFVFNIPLLLFTGRSLGKSFVGRTLLCATLYSLFCSLVPIPDQPVIEDTLTSCLLGTPSCPRPAPSGRRSHIYASVRSLAAPFSRYV